jgi:hypothetical protein
MPNHQEIVKKILDSKAVDFAAIGKVVAELGPSLSLADEDWEGVCGTMRYFIRFYIVNPFPFPQPPIDFNQEREQLG